MTRSYIHALNLVLFIVISLQSLVIYWEHQRICLVLGMLENEVQAESTVSHQIERIPNCTLPRVIPRTDADVGYIEQPREQ